MKKKIIIIIVAIIIALGLFLGYAYYKFMSLGKDYGMILDTDNYLSTVEVNSSANFMLYIDKNNNVSNLIYLDRESVKLLYNKGIEGKTKEEAIKIIIDTFSKDSKFLDSTDFILINYGDKNTYSMIKEEFNKEFVVYGINKDITEKEDTLLNKAKELNITDTDEIAIIKSLYYKSLEIVNNYYNNNSNYNDTDMSSFSKNIYEKLTKYSKDITNQEKNSSEGLDIRSINATNDYSNPLYPSEESWYYIENNKVFANIVFDYNGRKYNYCYSGNDSVWVGVCTE